MIKPEISVLMPVYNASTFLAEAINSILNQSFTNFEFIIINDGSTDDSFNILDSFKDKRIRIIHNKVNTGLALVRNQCIKEANTEFIAWCDADDVYYPERFKIQYEFMQNNTDIGFCSTNARIIDKNGNTLSNQMKIDYLLPAPWLLLWTNPIVQSSVMVRKSVLTSNNLKYRLEFPPVEDYDLWCRLILKTNYIMIRKVLMDYRVYPNSSFHSVKHNALNNVFNIACEYAYNITKSDVPVNLHKLLVNYHADILQKNDNYSLLNIYNWLDKVCFLYSKKWKLENRLTKQIKKDSYKRFLQSLVYNISIMNKIRLFEFLKLGIKNKNITFIYYSIQLIILKICDFGSLKSIIPISGIIVRTLPIIQFNEFVENLNNNYSTTKFDLIIQESILEKFNNTYNYNIHSIRDGKLNIFTGLMNYLNKKYEVAIIPINAVPCEFNKFKNILFFFIPIRAKTYQLFFANGQSKIYSRFLFLLYICGVFLSSNLLCLIIIISFLLIIYLI